MVPATREEFKWFCIRKITGGVTQLNLADEAIEDAIDEALNLYWEQHMDGSEQMLYRYQIQESDLTNMYITLPNTIIGVIEVFPLYSSIATNSIFNIRYQIALNDLYSLTNVDMVPYFMAMQHIEVLNQLLVGMPQFRYNKNTCLLYLDIDWTMAVPTNYFLCRVYNKVDPTVYPIVYSDFWLQRYATALIKERWGSVLKKFGSMQMPGGITFNGQSIYNEAVSEIAALRKELSETWSLPITTMFG